jgi:hypothetical protein
LVVSLILGALGYVVSSFIGRAVPEFSKLSLSPSSGTKEIGSHEVDYVLPQEIPGHILEALEKRLGEEEEASDEGESPAVGPEAVEEEETGDTTSDPQKMLAAMRAMIDKDRT